ncbi:MAG TPA: TOBE domain-containing protein, partial [Sphingomicrobium sp.]
VYVTHDQVEAMTLADRIAILDRGRVQQLGTPAELYERPASQFVAGFIGSPKMNFLEGTVELERDKASVRLGGGMLVETSIAAGTAKPGDAVTLGVRPEHLLLSTRQNGISATIALIEWLGNMRFAYLTSDVSDEPLIMQLEQGQQVKEGQQVVVAPDPQQCHLFDAEGSAFTRPSNSPGSMAA